MGRRPGTSVVLVLGAIVLLVAIGVGNSMGSRVIGQIAARNAPIATPIPIPSTPAPDAAANRVLWKRRQVISVATDPAFPDPRVTPEPEIPATPKPRKPTPRPTPKPSPSDEAPPPDQATDTTAPANEPSAGSPGPGVSGTPNEPSGAPATAAGPAAPRPPVRGAATPAPRNYPTLPPVTQPSFNP